MAPPGKKQTTSTDIDKLTKGLKKALACPVWMVSNAIQKRVDFAFFVAAISNKHRFCPTKKGAPPMRFYLHQGSPLFKTPAAPARHKTRSGVPLLECTVLDFELCTRGKASLRDYKWVLKFNVKGTPCAPTPTTLPLFAATTTPSLLTSSAIRPSA